MGIIETINFFAMEEGFEQGMEKGRKEIVRNLLQNTDFDAAKIASLVGVEENFVLEIKKNIGKV